MQMKIDNKKIHYNKFSDAPIIGSAIGIGPIAA